MHGNRLLLGLWILAACVLTLAGCGRQPPKALSDEEAYQRFVGRWVNTKYPGTLEFSQVTVIRPDRFGEDWAFPKSTTPMGEWRIRIRKTWVDEKGYTYIQSYNTRTKPAGMEHPAAALMRVDKKGKVWECCIKPFGFGRAPSFEEAVYPEEIDPNQYYYIYYRE